MALQEQLPAKAPLCPSVLPAVGICLPPPPRHLRLGEPPLVILRFGTLCFAGQEAFWGHFLR